MSKLKLYAHQQETVDFLNKQKRAFIASTAGVGKSATIVADITRRLNSNPMSKSLILAPKSLLDTVWKDEFNMWAPHVIVSVATAPTKKRLEAFERPANVYVTNIDALKWLSQQPPKFWDNFETVVIDESTSIANDSARTKAAMKIKKHFKYRRCMSGTPTSGLLTQLFYQYLFLDDGAHLGPSWYKFRNQVLVGKQTGPSPNMLTWTNKPGKEAVLAHLLKDMTIRHVLDEVIDMPPQVFYTYKYSANAKVAKAYKELQNSLKVQLKTGTVNAVNASALTQKLSQVAAGFILDTEKQESHLVDFQRYELVLDLCDQYKHAVVFFRWTAQREYFMEIAEKRGMKATFIDGSVSQINRTKRVSDFQAGLYDVIFLQPQSSAHGITLTTGHVTIWSCPTYLSDYYSQGNNRVYRAGQKKRTTVINVECTGTIDSLIYQRLQGKLNSMELLQDAL